MKTLIEKTLKNAAECSEKKNGEKIYLQDIYIKKTVLPLLKLLMINGLRITPE